MKVNNVYNIMGIAKQVALLGLSLLILLSFASCEKDDNKSGNYTDASSLVNEFVLSYNKTYYLWNSKNNYSIIDIDKVTDPFKLFDDLLYKELDIWSYLTNDADAMFDSYNGVETSYGYSLVLGSFSGSKEYFAIVKFVYPNSPASKAGIKRGDIIIKLNNSAITESNYLDLFYSAKADLLLGKYVPEQNAIGPSDKSVSLVAEKISIDAVNAYKIVEQDNHKIGYICYTDYVESSHNKLTHIFSEFKTYGVTDVVLDLRYNPGGAARSAQYLSSLLAPRGVVEKKDVYLKQIWNSELNDYWRSNGEDLTDYFVNDAISANLDLDRVFVLTTSGTASASEATIVGLMPYMEVIKIGETTHGKYCGALLLQPTNNKGEVIDIIKNWAMSIVVYKFANSNGFTDFTGGLAPDYEVKDNLLESHEFGDIEDPHFAKAVELITGKTSASTHSNCILPDRSFTLLKEQSEQLGRKGGFINQ